jgi:hypothetical protein
MKKLLMLAAAIGAAVFAVNKKKAQEQAKPDAWSQATDSL